MAEITCSALPERLPRVFFFDSGAWGRKNKRPLQNLRILLIHKKPISWKNERLAKLSTSRS
jgi:hypothetical protein